MAVASSTWPLSRVSSGSLVKPLCVRQSRVIAFTKVLSRELAARRINVNAVAPGVVLTEMGQSIPEAARAQMLAQIPLSRFGEADEIASVILFLCSHLSSYMTGQTLHVNGGWWA